MAHGVSEEGQTLGRPAEAVLDATDTTDSSDAFRRTSGQTFRRSQRIPSALGGQERSPTKKRSGFGAGSGRNA